MTRFTAAHTGVGLPVSAAEEPEEPEEPDPDVRRRTPARRRRRRALRVTVAIVAVAVVGATTSGWVAKTWLGTAVREVSALDPGSGEVVDAQAQDGDSNTLLVATEAGTAGSVVVTHVPAGTESTVAVSFPADLEVNRPPCDRFDPATGSYTDETVPAEARARLGSAWEVGGPRCATRVVQQLSGLAITAYVGTDLDRIGAAVDAVSGVGVCVTRPVRDAVLGPIVPVAGDNTLDGRRATDFVRAAEVDTDANAALGRVERQHQVLAGVLNAATSGTALLDVGQLTAVRSALAGAVVADGAGLDEILAVALSLQRLDAPRVTFTAVPTTGETSARGNAVVRDDAAALFTALRTNAALPDTAGGPDAGVAPSDVTVQIVNASDRAGLASEVGETLRSLGFGIGEPVNADQPTPQTLVRFSPDQLDAAELLAATVPSATSVPDPGATGVLQLVLGSSFDDVVRAPTEPAGLAASADGADLPQAEC